MQNSEASKEYLLAKLNQVIKDQQLSEVPFHKYDLQVREITTNGGNFLSNLYKADVIGETDKGQKEIHMFIKKIIPGNNMPLWSVSALHERELYFYNELSVKYNQLQIDAAIPEHERLRVAKSYVTNDSYLLMLENYEAKGYKLIFDRMDVVSLHYAETCIKQLAKLHALSFALEIKDPDYFKTNIKTKKNNYYICEETGYKQWESFLKKVSGSILHVLNDIAKEKLIKFIPEMTDKLKKYSIDTDNFKCCMIHGDYKPNNILSLETNGNLSDVIPVDYQMLQYASPWNDFIFYIFVCTDREFRKKHLIYLKNFYYDAMNNFLKYFDVNIQDVYPRNQFEKEYKDRLDFGLIMFIVLAPFLFAPDNDIPSFEQDLLSNTFSLVDQAKDRIEGVVQDFIDWGYL